MPETKYGKYIIREPMEKGSAAPSIHICSEGDCAGSIFPDFPAECQVLFIDKPTFMRPEPHAHEAPELFFIFGSNPKNFMEFDAEIELCLGEEQEKHIIDTSAIVYMPGGLMHCPVNIKKVNKPFIWAHVLLSNQYTASAGDISTHPDHSSRKHYTPKEAASMRKGVMV